MAGRVSDNHLAKLSLTVSRPRIPFGCFAVCSSAPHSQDAVEAMPRLCVDDRKRPTPVRRRFSRTQASLGNPISGGRASTSSKNECRQKVPSRHTMLPPVVRPSCCTSVQFARISEQFQSSRHKGVSSVRVGFMSSTSSWRNSETEIAQFLANNDYNGKLPGW